MSEILEALGMDHPLIQTKAATFEDILQAFADRAQAKIRLSNGYGYGYVKTRRDWRAMTRRVYMSDVVKPDHAIEIDEPFLQVTNGIYCHPIDYYWAKFWDKPHVARESVQRWMDERINKMADEALERIDNMFREKDEVPFRMRSDDVDISLQNGTIGFDPEKVKVYIRADGHWVEMKNHNYVTFLFESHAIVEELSETGTVWGPKAYSTGRKLALRPPESGITHELGGIRIQNDDYS